MLRYIKSLGQEINTYLRFNLGRMTREAGLHLDIKGAVLARDIAHMQPLNRHRNILSIDSQHPQISPSAYIAPNATVFGDVFVGQNSYFGFGSVAKGSTNAVRVGANTKVGDNTILDTNILGNDEAYPLSTNIGNNVNIQHDCHIMSSIIDDNVHVGFKTVIMEGCQIERGCVIEPNSYVPAGSRLPANTVWAGVPVAFVRNLEEKQAQQLGTASQEQVRIADV